MKYLLILAVVAALFWYLTRARARGRPRGMSMEEARRVLSIGPDADRAAVQEAHRRLIAKVHPDAGGSEELAGRVNAARDTLIQQMNLEDGRAS